MLRANLFSAVSAAVLTLPAAAQNYTLEPSYGSVNLTSGFTPDPHVVGVQAGGGVPASNLGANCSGQIADAPDYRVYYTAGSLPLIFSVESEADTTLVVNTPDGAWRCDDDGGESFNPSLRFDSPLSGQYDIWVGRFADPNLHDAQLHISELYSQ